jgi:hypothetical protein
VSEALTLRQKSLQATADRLHKKVVDSYAAGGRLAVIKAPPGSGKTFMLLRVIGSMVQKGWLVAIATQTNTQADDLVKQSVTNEVLKDFEVSRFGASGSVAPDGFPETANWITGAGDVPTKPGLVVGTSAKWATVKEPPPFDLFAVDEAWQMKWADMMRCSAVSDKYLLIGDPGQIPPVTSVDVSRWGTSQRPPHKAVPDVVLEKFTEAAEVGSLPSVRRLPFASVAYVKPFYDFDFEAFAEESDRVFEFTPALKDGSTEALPENTTSNHGYCSGSSNHDGPVVKLIEMLSTFEPILATIPTPADGPPAETDVEIALAVKRIVKGLLTLSVSISLKGDKPAATLAPTDIGVTSSHRAMNGLLRKTLGQDFADVRIDTPERWQGLEKPIMIAVHPLSGTQEPSDFDLLTGRLCVMASRHQIGLVIISRDHVPETLANTITFATQSPGQPDDTGRGRKAHVDLMDMLQNNKRFTSLL